MPAFSAASAIDFDGKGDKSTKLGNLIKETKQDKSQPLLTSPANTDNTPAKKLFEIKEDGSEELVHITLTSDGKEVYELRPNTYSYWTFHCTGQNLNPWGVCWSYTFRPATAGHNHTSTDPRSYSHINPDNGKPLPVEICKSGLTPNTPSRICFKAPVFSTLVLDKIKFSGGCSGTHSHEAHITVTAQNLIQLAELAEEPYFAFKPTSQYHPSNRFGTPDTNAKMKKIAWEYYQQFNQKLTVNDMGLAWGGRYHSPPIETNEIPNCWIDGQFHFYHRYGRQIDVRSSTVNTPQKRNCLSELACIYQVDPILEGKVPGSLLGRDVSMLSESELDALDRVEHYHFNFAKPTDLTVTPRDDYRKTCSSYLPPEVSVCPKPYSLK